ncbi:MULTISPECIES: hypothetical protein [Brucella/Ochrobactrum group]|uniref:hypothetical protein n=1 Tax=Brucella/Ochrobactrum group TaxID=2826938 RepID=UPI0015902E04|nr:hypothetical protein [Brucella tritici]MCI1002656.1 hypothetical protein [Ochrobactrum sp. C6C9]
MVLQTWPFILLRFIISMTSATIALATIATCAWVGFLIGAPSGENAAYTSGFVGALVGLSVFMSIAYILQEYVFYLLKAAHIAILAELIHGSVIEPSRQLETGVAIVRQHILASMTLFAVGQAIKSLIGVVSRFVTRGFSSFGSSGSSLGHIVQSYFSIVFGLADELVLAYILRAHEKAPQDAAREGAAHYARNIKALMSNAFALTIIHLLLSVLFYGAALAVSIVVVYFQGLSISSGIIMMYLIIAAGAMMRAFATPLIITCQMQVFFTAIENQTPDTRWLDRLTKSDHTKIMEAR